jgi:hypothetical protein
MRGSIMNARKIQDQKAIALGRSPAAQLARWMFIL